MYYNKNKRYERKHGGKNAFGRCQDCGKVILMYYTGQAKRCYSCEVARAIKGVKI